MQNLYVLRRLGNLSHGDSSRIFAMRLVSFCFILHNFMFTLISLMVDCKFRFASYVFNLAFYHPIYVLLIHWCIHNHHRDWKRILFIMHYVLSRGCNFYVISRSNCSYRCSFGLHTKRFVRKQYAIYLTINNPCSGISKTKLEALFKFLTSYSSNNRGGTRFRIVTGSVGERKQIALAGKINNRNRERKGNQIMDGKNINSHYNEAGATFDWICLYH